MSLKIEAPEIERRVRTMAARQGVTAETYLLHLVTTYLSIEEQGQASRDFAAGPRPFYETATMEEWLRAFDERIDSHPPRTPLPEDAFARGSFYPEQS